MAEYTSTIARISSTRQFEQGNTLPDQTKECKDYARRKGLEVAHSFEYVFSSTGQTQDTFKDECHYINQILDWHRQNPQVKNLIFKDFDRLSRSGPMIYTYIKTQFESIGVQLWDTTNVIQKPIDTFADLNFSYPFSIERPSESSEIAKTIEAQNEGNKIKRRLVRAEITYTQQGYSCHNPLYGFDNQKIQTPEGKRTIRVDKPSESRFIVALFENMALTQSKEDTVTKLNSMDYRNRTRTIWQKSSDGKRIPVGTKKGQTMTVKQLERYLHNVEYAGFKKEKWTHDKIIKAQYDGLVDVKLFNKANQGILEIIKLPDGTYDLIHNPKDPLRSKRRQKNNPAYPCKFMPCPICSKNLYGSAGKNKNGKHVGHYHCARGHKYWGINKIQFHQTLFNYVDTLKLSPDFINLFRIVLGEVWQQRQTNNQNTSNILQSRIKELEIKEESLTNNIGMLTSSIAMTALEKRIEENHNEILVTQRQLQENTDGIAIEFDQLFQDCAKYLEHPKEYLESIDNNPNQRRLLELFFNQPPTPDDIVNRTPKLAELYQLNQQSDLSKEHLVSSLYHRWNTYSIAS